MTLILHFIILIILCTISIQIYSANFNNRRILKHPSSNTSVYLMSPHTYLLIFIVGTAPFFLGSLSLVKYAFYYVMIIYLICVSKLVIKIDIIVVSYLLFLGWTLFSISYSENYYEGVMLLIKYSYPLLFLWLGYNAIEDKYSLYYFLKAITIIACIYALLIGGFSAKFMPWLYYSEFGRIFLKYAGLADFFTSIWVVPLTLSWITNKKRYLLVAIWLLLSTVLESVRTGIGGIFVVGIFYSFSRFKMKSIPFIGATTIGFIAIILLVPKVNNKMFGDKASQIEAKDIIANNALSLDNIQTSGRSFLWELALKKYYEPSPLIGSGVGSTTHYIKERARKLQAIPLLHNDYVQILCDTGLVGIILFSLFYLTVLCKTMYYIWIKNNRIWVAISATMAVSSLAGIAFSMAFDNVVSHSMTSLINPFIFIGFFLKFIDLHTNE